MLAPLALLALSACVGSPPIYATPGACSALIPDSWRKPVTGAPLPNGETVGAWIAFGDAQTGRLDVANGRTADTIGLMERCEKRDRDAIGKAKRHKILGVL